jgi:catechol 1,2-dioxygenase
VGVDGPTPACEETEDNILGPFYRAGAPFRAELNTQGRPGRTLVLEGVVLGPDCRTPLSGAVVDVWHADTDGAYDLTTSTFELRGRQTVGQDGAYRFATLLPGRYLNGATYRPRHIHLKAIAPGHVDLTTQVYFAGDPFNDTDPFIHKSLIVPLEPRAGGDRAVFRVVLARAL